MTDTCRQIRLATRPDGLPTDETWQFTEDPIPPTESLDEGQVLVKVRYLSVDPAMRGWLREGHSYVPPVGVGEVMRAAGIGEVLASRTTTLEAGDLVVAMTGVQTHAVIDGAEATKIPQGLAPETTFLGVLGMTGLTAYFGLLEVGALQEGETVLVSGAAGAVGSVVGQIAKIKGARAVGIAGGTEKCRRIVEEYGFDGAIDYKAEPVRERIRALCPDRVDVYFDNVGGAILDDALLCLARGARVVLCGAMSQYNRLEDVEGPANYLSLLVNRARMEGFVIFDYRARYMEGVMQLGGWFAEGKLRHDETVVEGLEAFPGALRGLFRGDNVGKMIVALP